MEIKWGDVNWNAVTAIATVAAVFGAIWIGRVQHRINKALYNVQDAVELFGLPASGQVHIQNVGTRLIYLEKYIFNGIVFDAYQQILPPSLHAPQAIYWIDLPPRPLETTHVSIEVFFRDVDGRNWKSTIFADYDTMKNIWKVNTRARDSMDSKGLLTRIKGYLKRML